MSLSGMVSFGLFTLLGLLAFPQVRRLWRHETRFYDRVPGWWPWGTDGWVIWVRSIPAGACAGISAIVLGLYVFFVSHLLKPPRQVDVVVIWILLTLFFGLFLLWGSVFYFGKPTVLVPPHLRRKPGSG